MDELPLYGWQYYYSPHSGERERGAMTTTTTTGGSSSWKFDLTAGAKRELAQPPGYTPANTLVEADPASSAKAIAVKTEMMQQRAMAVALAPGKNILMQGFMMWMSGSNINIFSIMITGMAFLNPIKAIIAIDEPFKRFRGYAVDLTIPKIAFVACNLGMICLALWKLNTMGLLPITAADWTSFLVDKEIIEASSPPLLV